MNIELQGAILVGGMSGLALAAYHSLHDHHRIEYYLHRFHRKMYVLHKVCYFLLWSAFLVNCRMCVRVILKYVGVM